MSLPEKRFKRKERGTAPRTELIAGMTSFFARVYILMVKANSLPAKFFCEIFDIILPFLSFSCYNIFIPLEGGLRCCIKISLKSI